MASIKYILIILYAIGLVQAGVLARALKALDIRCDCSRNVRNPPMCCVKPRPISTVTGNKQRRFVSRKGEFHCFSALTKRYSSRGCIEMKLGGVKNVLFGLRWF